MRSLRLIIVHKKKMKKNSAYLDIRGDSKSPRMNGNPSGRVYINRMDVKRTVMGGMGGVMLRSQSVIQ